MDHAAHCDALELEVERFAVTMSQVSGDTTVATCPGWTVNDVAVHLGTIHRWADELVRTRSTVRIPRVTPSSNEITVTPEWLREGGQQLVGTLRDAEPNDAMWAWGLDQHVRFWSRRQVHETLVHRMDLELATGIEPTTDTELASDAIDEFLSNLQKVTNASAEPTLSGNGERISVRASDLNAGWLITLRDGGFDLAPVSEECDALVYGPSVELLLVLVRRRPIARASVEVSGNSNLVEFWLAHSDFD